ncbi:MAG: PDZ domain-containing protein [candidate division Zixibacteria bacterium]|nr:PDZ domain-containing protein [candidate division Zixibacteria bacterium]
MRVEPGHNTATAHPFRAGVAALVVALLACGMSTIAFASDSDSGSVSLLQVLEREMRSVIQSVSPSVVTIRATRSVNAGSDTDPASSAMSVASGIVLDSTGMIMTVPSVVLGADDYWIETFDGRLFQAVMVGASEDVAVLQVRKGRDFVPARLGSSDDLGVGSFVVSLGNSYGFAGGAAWGEVNGFRPDGTIQLSLGVSPGNTGGAVVNTRGLVIGMVRAKISEPFYLDPMYCRTGEKKNLVQLPGRRLELPTSPVSLAVPIQTAVREAQRILEAGTEARAYVGVYVDDLTGWYALHFKTTDGVLVTGVVNRTPADRSGLQQADVITSVDGVPVRSVQQFRQLVAQATPGQRLQFDIVRGGQALKLMVETASSGMTHLSPTDGSSRPYPTAAVGRQASAVQLSTGSSSPTVRATPNAEEPMTAGGPPETEWEAVLDSLRRTIDSLRQEVHQLKRSTQR